MSSPDRIQKFYIGFYGRPADLPGFAYWLEQVNGAFLNQDSRMAAAFGSTDQAEFRALYGQQPTIELFVSKVYENLFGRAAEVEGVAYYKQEYDKFLAANVSANEARAILIARIIDGAQGGDRIAINNKVEIAQDFTDESRLKVAAVSDNSDLLKVQNFFKGSGDDAWKTFAKDRVALLVDDVRNNDSVSDYISVLTAAGRGVTPIPEAEARISYSSGFLLESNTNTGQISGSIQIRVEGDTFAGVVGSSRGAVANVPAGLTANLIKTSDTTLSLNFSGRATSHGFLNSTAVISVTFSNSDFSNLSANEIEGSVRQNLGIGFIDSALYVLDGLVRANGEISSALRIDLNANSLSLGAQASRPIFGTITEATGADLSDTLGTSGATSVTFRGNALNNIYVASYNGDLIRGGGGNDTLMGGLGVDTFIFESSATANGVDRIQGFNIGKGDVLNLSAYLNVTGTGNIEAKTASSEQVEWENGDILVYQGVPVLTAAGVAALFDASGSDLTRPFSYPRTDGKAVVITTGVAGDARLWFLKKEANVTSIFASDSNVITEDEIQLVAILEDVSNLTLVGFSSSNFA